MKKWLNAAQPVGIVQIITSTDKTTKQYDKLAFFLNKNGYLVFCNDKQSVHGDVFSQTVEQEIKTIKKIKQKYNLPVFLVGHGFGGFIAQKIISQYDVCDGAIYTSGGEQISQTKLYQHAITTWIGRYIFGDNAHAKMLYQLYKHDKGITYKMSYWIIKNIQDINYRKFTKIPHLFLCSGHNIINPGKRLAWTLYNAYSMHDLHKLTIVIYPDISQPISRQEQWTDMQNDILQFLVKHNNAHR